MATQDQTEMKTTALGQQAIALAEELGRIAGTIEGTADQWLNRQALTDQLTRVRDGAAELLDSLASGAAKGRKTANDSAEAMTSQVRQTASRAMATATSLGSSLVRAAAAGSASRRAAKGKKSSGATARKTSGADPAHAPGKRHRKPPKSNARGRKSDVKVANLRVAEANRRRRPSNV
jgi:hypothetical protein